MEVNKTLRPDRDEGGWGGWGVCGVCGWVGACRAVPRAPEDAPAVRRRVGAATGHPIAAVSSRAIGCPRRSCYDRKPRHDPFGRRATGGGWGGPFGARELRGQPRRAADAMDAMNGRPRCQRRAVASDHVQARGGERGAEPGGSGGRAGADHVRQRGDRLHGRPGRHRPRRRRSAHGRRGAARRPAGRVPAHGGPLGLPSAVRQAVHRRELHDRAARPPSRASAAISAPAWSRASARSSPTASSQHFGLDTLQVIEEEPERLIEVPGLGPKRTKKIADGLGGAEGDQGGDGLPPGRRGVHLHRGAHLQEVRRRLDLGGEEPAVPARRRRLGHRLPDRRQDRPVRRHPARQPGAGQGRACSTPCRSPPTRATATSPRSS